MSKILQSNAYIYLQTAIWLGVFYSLAYGYLFLGIAFIFAMNGLVYMKHGVKRS